MQLPVPDTPFWAREMESRYDPSPASVVDATFVDDECLVILSSSCASLDVPIDILLGSLFGIFEDLHLAINTAWEDGGPVAVQGEGSGCAP